MPLTSASLEGVPQFFVRGASHSTLPSSEGVPESIQNVILDASDPSSNGVSKDKSTCGVSGTIVSKHSPVRMDIYDANGNHTGPMTDGMIEYGIDGVSYDQIGEDAFAFLPSGTTYRVTNTATDVGGYDFYIKKVDCDDVVTKEYYFHDIPIAVEGVVSQIQIDDDLNAPKIVVDPSDGADGAVYTPSSTVSGKAVEDSVAPVSSASFSDAGILTLIASDQDSGILEIEYSIDEGTTWNQYHDSFDASGMTVQYFAIDSVGNTEDVKTITVPEKKEEKHDDVSSGSSGNTVQRNSGAPRLLTSPESITPTQTISEPAKSVSTVVDTPIIGTKDQQVINSKVTNHLSTKQVDTIERGVKVIRPEIHDVLRADAEQSGFVDDNRRFFGDGYLMVF